MPGRRPLLCFSLYAYLLTQCLPCLSKEEGTEERCKGIFGETCLNGVAHNFIDDYHFPMVVDELRNEPFYRALQKYIVANHSVVLDVGAGSGLLSLTQKHISQ
jgi:hypothetical protein